MENNDIKKALECCTSPDGEDTCLLCPYNDINLCAQSLMAHSLALITSQEQRIKELTEETESLKQAMEHEHASFMEIFGEYAEKCERLTEENERLKTRYVSADNLIIAETARKIFDRLEAKLRMCFINGDEENVMLIVGYDDYDAIKKELEVNQDE